jgi:hypothetical protein
VAADDGTGYPPQSLELPARSTAAQAIGERFADLRAPERRMHDTEAPFGSAEPREVAEGRLLSVRT